MWTSVVVFIHRFFCQLPDLIQFKEKTSVKDKFSADSIEPFNESILHRSSSLNKLELNFTVFYIKLKVFWFELWPILCQIIFGLHNSQITLSRFLWYIEITTMCRFLWPEPHGCSHQSKWIFSGVHTPENLFIILFIWNTEVVSF